MALAQLVYEERTHHSCSGACVAFYITASFLESGQVNVEGIANATPKGKQNFVHCRQIRGREFKEGKSLLMVHSL